MKTPFLLTALLSAALAAGAMAADEGAAKEGCKMMKKEPAPEPACCCQKMMAKKEAAPAPDLDALVEKMKTARGDQVLDAFAAVLNKLLAERKAAQDGAPEAPAPAAPPAHQH